MCKEIFGASYRLPPRRMELAYFRAQNSANVFHEKWVPERCLVEFSTYMFPPNNSPSAKKPKSATAMDIVS